jgi:hypothetical protein
MSLGDDSNEAPKVGPFIEDLVVQIVSPDLVQKAADQPLVGIPDDPDDPKVVTVKTGRYLRIGPVSMDGAI